MRKIILFSLLVLLFLISSPSFANPAYDLRQALKSLDEGKLEEAETNLHKARFKNSDAPEIPYNLGIINYRKRNYQKAAQFFSEADSKSDAPNLKFSSKYNLGNSLFKQGDFASAVQAYKESLEIKDDQMARYNLSVAEENLKKNLQNTDSDDNQQSDSDKDDSNKQSKDNKQSQKQSDKQSQNADSNKSEGTDNNQQRNEQSSQENSESNNESSSSQDSQDSQDSQTAQGDSENSQNQDENQSAQSDSADKESEDEQAAKHKNADDNQQDEQNKDSQTLTQDSQQERQNFEMPQQSDTPIDHKPTERAKALKNVELNPYMIEKIIQQMKEREREVQARFRNESSLDEDQKDPYTMTPQEREKYFQQQRQRQKSPDSQSW